MPKRQIPGKIPDDLFVSKMAFLESFLGTEWLNSQQIDNSVFTVLWNRQDFLASIELFTISHSIEIFQAENEEWLNEFKRTIKEGRNIDIISESYEINSAAMLYNDNQKVELCSFYNPGYDFVLKIAEKNIRVSCKKLQASDKEKEFNNNAKEIYQLILEYMQKNRLNFLEVILSFLKTDEFIEHDNLKQQIIACLNDYKNGKRVYGYQIGGWFLRIFEMPLDLKGYRFYPNSISLMFLCMSPYFHNEQTRFENLFRKAAKNLKKHGKPINKDNINIIMIGIPASISLVTAKKWLQAKFERENSSISAVFLTRTIPVSEKDLSSTHPQNEVSFVINPFAIIKWQEFIPKDYVLKADLQFGTITEEPSKIVLIADEKQLELEEVYMFQKGQVFHEHISGEMTYEFNRKPGIQQSVVFRPIPGQEQMILSSISPPEDSFIII